MFAHKYHQTQTDTIGLSNIIACLCVCRPGVMHAPCTLCWRSRRAYTGSVCVEAGGGRRSCTTRVPNIFRWPYRDVASTTSISCLCSKVSGMSECDVLCLIVEVYGTYASEQQPRYSSIRLFSQQPYYMAVRHGSPTVAMCKCSNNSNSGYWELSSVSTGKIA